MPLLSIIVPIYNVEQYLANCIESILIQTFNDFELILVNDGSTDSCGEICNYYAKIDNRVLVIHKTNGGVSSARNAGIDKATGEYIAFIDPDDSIEPNMYELLLKAALLHKVDIVICPIKIIDISNNTRSISSIWTDINCIIGKQEIEKYLIPSILVNRTYSLVSSVNKLYRKSLFDLFNIRFDEHKHHSEDARLNFTLLPLINNLVYIEQPLYNYYLRRRNSLSKVFREDLYEYILDNKSFLIELCRKYSLANKIDTVRKHFMQVTLGYMQDIVNSEISTNKKYKMLLEILNDKEFIEDIKVYKCPSIYYWLLKRICILKNERLFFNIVNTKNRYS